MAGRQRASADDRGDEVRKASGHQALFSFPEPRIDSEPIQLPSF